MDILYKPDEFLKKKSNIKDAGLGLFSLCNIPKGTIIGKYDGIRYPSYFELSEKEAIYAYTTKDGKGEHIIPDESCPFKYINDIVDFNSSIRCDKRVYLLNYYHNVKFLEINDDVFIKTLNDIHIGEELFIKYGFGYWMSQITLFKFQHYYSFFDRELSFENEDISFSDDDFEKPFRRINSSFF